MAGRMYSDDPKLNKAFAEGYAGVPAANPHASGSDAYTAYAAGATQAGTETPCSPFAGVTQCSAPAGPGVLTVESTVPDDEDTDVAVDATVTITFSTFLDDYSFSGASITLTSGNPAVETDYTQAFGETNDILILTPDDDLEFETEYTLTVSGVVSSNKDFMVEDSVSTFTTVAESP